MLSTFVISWVFSERPPFAPSAMTRPKRSQTPLLTRHIKLAKILKAYNGQKRALHLPLMKALDSIQCVLVKLSTMVDSSLQGSLAGADFRACG